MTDDLKTVACIQARMGSSRLPGKMMLPLDSSHVLQHDVRRVAAADSVDEVVVATSDKQQDDIVARYATREGASVFRGSEDDVLGRMYAAARKHDTDIVVRVTGDNPLVSPEFIDRSVQELVDRGSDCVSARLERTFPYEITTETFTFDSFETVEAASDQPHQREHVTQYYYEHPEEFDLYNVTSEQLFDEASLQNRSNLRLTLDEADDYEVFRRIYEGVEYDEIVDVADAVHYVDAEGLAEINQHIQ